MQLLLSEADSNPRSLSGLGAGAAVLSTVAPITDYRNSRSAIHRLRGSLAGIFLIQSGSS